MRTLRGAILCGVLAALVQPLAGAQGPGTEGRPAPTRGRQMSIDLATMPPRSIDYVVALTADQQTRIAAIQEKYADDDRALRPIRGAAPDPALRQKRTELRREATKDILALLRDEQKKRLREAAPWLAPLRTAGVPLAILATLKPTKEQQARLAAIGRDAQEKRRALPAGMTPQERREKARPIAEEVRAKVTDLLTADQKAAVEKYNQEHRRTRRGRAN